ncbi:MAG: serine hydrolase domain-containing protein, partial [Bacteroidota bacterium]
MKNSVFLFFLSLVFFSCKQNGETQKSSERDDYSSIKDTLTRDLQSAFAKNAIIGFSVSVVDDEGLIYENGFGHTDIELTKKYTPSTIQNIASISKTLIGIALLKAQEQG